MREHNDVRDDADTPGRYGDDRPVAVDSHDGEGDPGGHTGHHLDDGDVPDGYTRHSDLPDEQVGDDDRDHEDVTDTTDHDTDHEDATDTTDHDTDHEDVTDTAEGHDAGGAEPAAEGQDAGTVPATGTRSGPDAVPGRDGVTDRDVAVGHAAVPGQEQDTVTGDDTVAGGGAVPAGTGADGSPQRELMPGDVAAAPVAAVWTDDATRDFRERWLDVQVRFVDDPQGAARDAGALVDEVVASLVSALSEQKRKLDSWSGDQGGDTERHRVALRQYRDFFDRILGL